MTSRNRTLLLAGLALCAAVPLLVVAGIPVPPASQAACCNTADQPPPPTANGDEAFFSIPGGVPNIMLTVDTSGSMLGLPRDVTYPTWTADNTKRGSCLAADSWLAAETPRDTLGNPDTTRKPYDNGFNNDGGTYDTVDDPPWGLKRCEAKQARPAGDDVDDYCLFRPDSYYKGLGSLNSSSGWDTTSTTVYNANPCAAIAANDGPPRTDYLGNIVQANDLAECRACLDSAGFYIMNPRYQTSATNWANAGNQVVFAGWFLNAFPPKYVAARKVVKDLVRLDATPRPTTDAVRFGLTVFNGSGTSGYSSSLRAADGGKLVVPLGPNCDQAFPVTRTAFATARQVLIDAVNSTKTATDWSTGLHVVFSGTTPLAETMFNVGQYFTNTGSTALYTSLFTNSWVRASFAETASGSVGALATWTGAGKNQRSFCWACQQSSAILVTDGAPNEDSNLPKYPTPSANHAVFNSDFRRWSNATVDCAGCGTDLSGSPANTLHKVAYFLSQTDLRPDLANGATKQNLSVYTIGLGIDPAASAANAAAVTLLNKTALLGGGLFANTTSAQELADALTVAVSDVVSRATAFSSANTNSIQLSRTSGADAYLGRFRPGNSAMWEGHLFAAQIFDEFGQGCDERYATVAQQSVQCGQSATNLVNPNIDGDEYPAGHPQVGKAACSSVYLVDRDCDPVVEDSAGAFKKGHFDPTTHQLISDPDDALMYWDAGYALSNPYLPDGTTPTPGYRSATEDVNDTQRRRISTIIDVNGDGRMTGADGLVEFTAANAAALAPMMNLPLAPAADISWDCKTWLNTIGVCGTAPLPACPAVAADLRTKCAEHVIHFYRGWDVMDWDNDHCSGPGAYYNTNGWGTCTTAANCGGTATCVSGKCRTAACAGGEQRDRSNDSRTLANQEFWKLGDIFHSSPVLVKPPLDKALCTLRNTQCQDTVYSAVYKGAAATPTPLATSGGLDAYDLWRRDNLNRQQVVVVGANDMMFHAFDAGVADTGGTPDADGQYPYTQGTGGELWAFVPPDLLPRLKEGLVKHVYGVDGSTMVKDIWVDLNGNGTKERTEFKTVAIITERGGGTHWTALDITDPTAPAFLWTFPESCTEDAKLVAQSWSDFLPRPSPVLPVRLATPKNGPKDPGGRGFEERWIVMVNGGYDPALVRGRAVWMLDAWTGKWLWRFTDADLKTVRGDTKASMFPVAAAVGLVDLGSGASSTGTYDTDGYFDTATWGDLGGNLFVARFHEPGVLDGSGHVTNWTAARTFETQRQLDDTQKITDRGEVFFMTGNGIDPSNTGRLITTFGTGNREKLMQTGNSCGPNNVAGCCWSGCTVTAASTTAVGTCSQGGTFQCSAAGLSYTPAATAGCGIQGSPNSCAGSSNKVDLTFDCGAVGTRTITANLVCDADGVCTTEAPSGSGDFSTAVLARPKPQYRAYGLWSYGMVDAKKFSTVAEAKAFDGQRSTDLPYSGCSAVSSGTCTLVETSPAEVKQTAVGLTTSCRGGATKCKATSEDLGWMYSYGQHCPFESCSPATWDDERTGTAMAPWASCAVWSGFRPTGAASGSDPCTASTGSPSSNAYSLDAFSGVPRKGCGVEDTSPVLAYYAASQRNALAAPQNASVRFVMNQRGQINTSLLKIETGSPAQKQSLTTRNSLAEPLYWLEVPQVSHTCRHVDPTTCK